MCLRNVVLLEFISPATVVSPCDWHSSHFMRSYSYDAHMIRTRMGSLSPLGVFMSMCVCVDGCCETLNSNRDFHVKCFQSVMKIGCT